MKLSDLKRIVNTQLDERVIDESAIITAILSYKRIKLDRLIHDDLKRQDILQVRPKTISEKVHLLCALFNMDYSFVISKSQKREVTIPRQVIAYTLYSPGSVSYKEIGDELNKDHSSILNAVRRTENDIDCNFEPVMRLIKLVKENTELLK